MTLQENGCIWAVSLVSKDDGTTNCHGYFTDKTKADKFAAKIGGKVFQESLFYENDGENRRYYKVHFVEVPVDLPSREEVLAKLTRQERTALGI